VDYSQPKQSIQVCYEDGDEKWHKLDDVESFASGTLDGRTSKFRLGGSDNNTSAFPAIPPASKDLPKEIFCSSALRLWWLQDRKYHRPNTALLLEIVCQKALQDPTYAAVADLMVDLVVDALTETTYMAEMCELSSSIEATDVGFQIHLTGFNEKLPAFLTQTLDMFFSFKNEVPLVMKSRYDTCLSALQRYYRNQGVKVSDFAEDIRIEAIRSALPSSNKRLLALSELSEEEFFTIAKDLLSVYAVEALLHGNEDEDDAKRISTTLLRYTSATGLARKNYPPQSILKIPSVRSPTILRVPSKNPDANTTCEVYLQISKDNVRDRVLVDLLTEVMHEPLYDQVRTKDQFGYDVGVDSRWSHGIIGCLFYVTTNVKSADDVMDRIDRFLLDFRVTLDEMSDTDYNDHLIGLANRYLDMYNSMDEETSIYWSEIVNGRFEWEGWREETSILIQTPKTEVIEAFDKWFKPGTERRIMAVQVIGTEPQVCCGRPETSDTADAYADSMVGMFHGKCKTQQWGRVNSKLR
jgi:nardilysin